MVLVDPDILRSGATDSTRAAGYARAGADRLAESPLPAGMFGDLSAARSFHRTLTEARAQHVETSRSHRSALTGIGRRARRAADGFTDMERQNAAAVGAVGREPG